MSFSVAGEVRVPGDKSISHRSLMLASVARGTTRIRGILRSDDVQSTAGILRMLGVSIPPLAHEITVTGVDRNGLRAPNAALDCGNSGTTARLMSGIAAASPFQSQFIGDASLSRRPMRRVATPLSQMGARFDLPPHGGLPMTITGGKLSPIHYFTETSSAQVKSAILLAACVAGIPSSVTEPIASRDHTERMIEAWGAHVHIETVADGHCIHVGPLDHFVPRDIDVPSDASSAAFFAGLAALAGSGEIVMHGVSINRTRAGAFEALRRMGARVEMSDRVELNGEPVATIVARPGSLKGATVGGVEIPTLIDEIPLLACVAARAQGDTVVTGASELRVKESDRIAAIVGNLRAIGASAEELPDGLRVTGSDRPLKGRITTHGDHRIAMAFGVLGAVPGNAIEIDDPACASVSYPEFWDDLRAVVSV